MKFEKSPSTFAVEEILQPVFDNGKYNYYILSKTGIDSFNAAKILGKENNAKIFFSGIKDAQAKTKQWICSEKELKEPADERISIEFAGKSSKKIFTGMHSENEFKITITALSENEKKTISKNLKKTIFPNYFDAQRFNEKTIALGKALLDGNWETAVKIALTKELSGFESEKSVEIKKNIEKNWGNWEKLSLDESIPQSKRQIFEFLQKESDFKQAVFLLEPKTVSIACRAIQALQFNDLLKEEILKQKKAQQKSIEINSQNYPIIFSPHSIKRELEVKEVFPKKTTLKRKTFFEAKNAKTIIYGNNAMLNFRLKKGCFGTILIKCLEKISE